MPLIPATAKSKGGADQELVRGDAILQVVDGAAENQGEEDPDAVHDENAEDAPVRKRCGISSDRERVG